MQPVAFVQFRCHSNIFYREKDNSPSRMFQVRHTLSSCFERTPNMKGNNGIANRKKNIIEISTFEMLLQYGIEKFSWHLAGLLQNCRKDVQEE